MFFFQQHFTDNRTETPRNKLQAPKLLIPMHGFITFSPNKTEVPMLNIEISCNGSFPHRSWYFSQVFHLSCSVSSLFYFFFNPRLALDFECPDSNFPLTIILGGSPGHVSAIWFCKGFEFIDRDRQTILPSNIGSQHCPPEFHLEFSIHSIMKT